MKTKSMLEYNLTKNLNVYLVDYEKRDKWWENNKNKIKIK